MRRVGEVLGAPGPVELQPCAGRRRLRVLARIGVAVDVREDDRSTVARRGRRAARRAEADRAGSVWTQTARPARVRGRGRRERRRLERREPVVARARLDHARRGSPSAMRERLRRARSRCAARRAAVAGERSARRGAGRSRRRRGARSRGDPSEPARRGRGRAASSRRARPAGGNEGVCLGDRLVDARKSSPGWTGVSRKRCSWASHGPSSPGRRRPADGADDRRLLPLP